MAGQGQGSDGRQGRRPDRRPGLGARRQPEHGGRRAAGPHRQCRPAGRHEGRVQLRPTCAEAHRLYRRHLPHPHARRGARHRQAAPRRPVAAHRGGQAVAAHRQDLPPGPGCRGACAHEGQCPFWQDRPRRLTPSHPQGHPMSKSINHLATADGLFFGQGKGKGGGLDQRRTAKMVDEALAGCDDGELCLEYEQSESLAFDDGKLKSASYDTTQGFGLRSVAGEATGFAHASALDEAALKRAVATVKAVRAGKSRKIHESPRGTNHLLYADDNPIDGEPFARKVALLEQIDAYVRGKEPKARQVSISMAASGQVVEIIRAGGWRAADVRPLVRLNVSVVCADGSRMESGGTGSGQRAAYGDIFKPEHWQREADEAIRQALVNLQSVPAPAGEMPVVLGPGWSGVLWHEAVGHGLEGDFHRKKTSIFTKMMGDMIASPGVTVVDDGTLADPRGSLTR